MAECLACDRAGFARISLSLISDRHRLLSGKATGQSVIPSNVRRTARRHTGLARSARRTRLGSASLVGHPHAARPTPGHGQYLNSLRESILEAYTGIVQGLNDGAKAPLIVPCLEPIFLFLSKILRDHTERNLVDASVLQAAIGMLGDLTHALGRDIYSFVARPEVAKLLEEGASASSSDGMRQIVAWTHERIAEVTKGAR